MVSAMSNRISSSVNPMNLPFRGRRFGGAFGPCRRMVLDHLGNRFQRRFADQWEFVRFATEQRLFLNFTDPPQAEMVEAGKP